MELCMSMKLLLCIYYQYIYIILLLSIKHPLCASFFFFFCSWSICKEIKDQNSVFKEEISYQRDKKQTYQIVYKYAMKVRNTPFLLKASHML